MFEYKEATTVEIDGMRWYVIDENRIYPSITTVLSRTQSDEKKQILEDWKARVGEEEANKISSNATRRGTIVHLLAEQFLNGDEINAPDALEQDLLMFRSMIPKLKKVTKVYGQEVVLFSDTLKVAGRCDLVCEFESIEAIVDYKTSRRNKTSEMIEDYWIQIDFYATAHNEMFGTNIKKGIVIMGVEDQPALLFRKNLDDALLTLLINKVDKFYSGLLNV